MKRMRNLLWLLLALVLLAPAAHAQQEDEEMSRFFREKDWLTWQQALTNPQAAKKLFIRDKAPLDYEALKHFTNLEQLIVYESPLQDLTWLKDHPKLQVLEFQGNSLKTLEGIQNLPHLREFACNANFIRDLRPLDSLLDLTWLQLYDNDIESLEPIGHLENVTFLDVSRNSIRSLAPISQWTWLEHLSVYNCQNLMDIACIADFKQLKALNISFLPIPDFSLKMLEDHVRLENLRIQGMVHSNEELNYIKHLPNVAQLTMGKNDNVTNIDSLRYLTKLLYLDIHSNEISDISVVRNFPKLGKLVIYRNKITDIGPLAELKALGSLFAHENPIQDYSPLNTMTQLLHLSLDQKAFTKEQAIALKKVLKTTDVDFY